LLAEFLGRLPVRVELDALSEEDLYLVMTAPPDSVVREYQALLKMDGIDLQFPDETLRAIAQFCIRRRTGARSLRTFIEEICHDIMFEAPEHKGETISIEPGVAMAKLERLADGAARNAGPARNDRGLAR
jgi:ATP-dependent Clp protease ATP-binding subunit ClpX